VRSCGPCSHRGRIVVALACLLSAVSARDVDADGVQQAAGRDELARLSLEELGNIEVSSVSKTPEMLRRIPAAIYVITQEDIRRSGATTLPDILRLAPGVDVARIDSDHWAVGVRGFGDGFSKSVLVLIDGRNVYTPLFAGIYWGAQDTLIEDIERVEVIRGPGGTVWGANAANGVINIITKNSSQTTGLLASARVGSTDRAIGGVRAGGRNGGFTYRVYGKGFDRQPQFHTDGRDYDSWHLGQAGFRTDWSQSSDNLTIQGDIYKASEGQNVVFGSFSPAADVMSYDPVDLSGGNLLANWRRSFARGGDVLVQAYYDRTSILAPQLGETRNTLDVDFVHHIGGVQRQDIRWGLGMRVSPSRLTQTIPAIDLIPRDETNTLYSAFAQDEVALIPGTLSLTFGAKVEHNNYTGAEVQPSARLSWTPTERQSMWAAVTRAVRTPSEIEEAFRLDRFLAPAGPTYLQVRGNPDFLVERNIGYESGYRVSMNDRLFVDFSAFWNRHESLESFGNAFAVAEPTPAPPHVLFVLPYANGVNGNSGGFEVAPDWKPTVWTQFKGYYSYLSIDVHNSPGINDILQVVSTYEGSSPRHQIVLQPLITLPRGWEIDQTYRYVSALVNTGVPARNIDAYATMDLRVGRKLSKDLEVSVVGQNLFQDHHHEFPHDPGPHVAVERAVYASVTWRR
jgi:iron complex outermembrane receptor protein